MVDQRLLDCGRGTRMRDHQEIGQGPGVEFTQDRLQAQGPRRVHGHLGQHLAGRQARIGRGQGPQLVDERQDRGILSGDLRGGQAVGADADRRRL